MAAHRNCVSAGSALATGVKQRDTLWTKKPQKASRGCNSRWTNFEDYLATSVLKVRRSKTVLSAMLLLLVGALLFQTTLGFQPNFHNFTSSVSGNCRVRMADSTLNDYLMTVDESVKLLEMHVSFTNYSEHSPFGFSKNYKPWVWYWAASQHGRTLLMLSFHYDILSMSVLTIGVEAISIVLTDSPPTCFRKLGPNEKVDLVRRLLLSNLCEAERLENLQRYSEQKIYVCNHVIQSRDGYATFANRCCRQEQNGRLSCDSLAEDLWISVLYWIISVIKVAVFLFSPLLIPQSMYNAAYVASEYVVKLKEPLKMKILVSDSADGLVRARNYLKSKDIADWRKFQASLKTLPRDEVISISMSELRIKVKGKRIIEEKAPPTGLLRTLYDNLIRCKVKNIYPFTECCESSVYGSWSLSLFQNNVSWHLCMKSFVKLILLLALPLPYYIRVLIYYFYERDELSFRRIAIQALRLKEPYIFYRTSVLQHLSPTHPIFISTYVFYVSSGLILAFSHHAVRVKIKDMARGSLEDMRRVSSVTAMQIITRLILLPFTKFGIVGCTIAPFYWLPVLPCAALLLVLYCIPTVFLSLSLVFHSRQQFSLNTEISKAIPRRIRRGLRRVRKQVLSLHPFSRPAPRPSASFKIKTWHCIKMIAAQVTASTFCLATLYTFVLLSVECVTLVIEVCAFTMMGIIVNAGVTLKYVTMVLLVFVYMHDCYSNVYENYITFAKSIVEDMIGRVDDVQKIACLPSSVQENAAFQVNLAEGAPLKATTFDHKKSEPRWSIPHLQLFLDSYDTPRIPLRVFQKFCEIRVYGCPGPVFLNLLRATGKFLTIVLFLVFVMIVVMAFGNIYGISSTNQTLAAMAGGFVPLLLKSVLSSHVVKLSLKTLSFKGQVDEIAAEYKQKWPISDLVIEGEEDGGNSESPDDEASDVVSGTEADNGNGGDVDSKANVVNGGDVDLNYDVDLCIDLRDNDVDDGVWEVTPAESLEGFPAEKPRRSDSEDILKNV